METHRDARRRRLPRLHLQVPQPLLHQREERLALAFVAGGQLQTDGGRGQRRGAVTAAPGKDVARMSPALRPSRPSRDAPITHSPTPCPKPDPLKR